MGRVKLTLFMLMYLNVLSLFSFVSASALMEIRKEGVLMPGVSISTLGVVVLTVIITGTASIILLEIARKDVSKDKKNIQELQVGPFQSLLQIQTPFSHLPC